MKRVAPEIEQGVVEAWRSGERSTTQLARDHGIHDSTVRSILRRNDCGPLDRVAVIRKTTTEQDAEIIRLYGEGLSAGRIGAQVGLAQASVLNRVREAGIQPRSKGFRQPLAQAVVDEIVRLRKAGHGVVEIGKMLDIGYPRVRACLHEAGQPTWNTARRNPWTRRDGYVMQPLENDDPLISMANGRGYAPLHRLVLARSLGRPLSESETVHHINGDRSDNRLENLQLRQGRHGKHAHYRCRDCGSHNVEPVPI